MNLILGTVSGKKGGGGGSSGPLMASTPARPASSQSSDTPPGHAPGSERVRQRRRSVDERSERGSEYGGSRKGSSAAKSPVGFQNAMQECNDIKLVMNNNIIFTLCRRRAARC